MQVQPGHPSGCSHFSGKSQLLPNSTGESPGCCLPQSPSHALKELCRPSQLSRQPCCHLTAGPWSNSQLTADFFFFVSKFNCSVSFLSFVFLICIGLGLVKFIILHCGDIFSVEIGEQSHLNPCKSCGEQTCCPKAPAQ